MNGSRVPGSLKLASVLGIDVKLHITFLLYIVFALATSKNIQLELMILVILFGSVLLHEIGHCLGARAVQGSADEIILWPLGGLALLRHPNDAKSEFVSTACGPLVNLLLLGLGYLVLISGAVAPLEATLQAGDRVSGAQVFVHYLIRINLILFLFNVIPAYPMDGGRLLRSMLWPLLRWRTATLVATVTAMICASAFVVAAFVWLEDPFLALIGALVGYVSYTEFKRAKAFIPGPDRWSDDDLMPHERGRR